MKKKLVISGVISAVVGVVFLMMSLGLLAMPAAASVVTDKGTVSMELTTTVKNYPYPLATVAPSGTYSWNVNLRNTGTLDWDAAQVCVRILNPNSQVVTVTNEWLLGEYLAGKCQVGGQWYTDNYLCRENIEPPVPDGWDMHYRTAGTTTWYDIADEKSGDEVFCPNFQAVPVGQSISFDYYVTVPADRQGTYPMLVNAWVTAAGTKQMVSYKQEGITVGTISGDLTTAFMGVTFLGAAIAALAIGFKP